MLGVEFSPLPPTKKRYVRSEPLVPQNVFLFGDRVIAGVIS